MLLAFLLFVFVLPINAYALDEDAVHQRIDKESRIRLAKMLYGEDRYGNFTPYGIMLKAAVVQCALNRLDTGAMGTTIEEIVIRDQFHGYDKDNPVEDWAMNIVNTMCDAWEVEQITGENKYRILPKEYLFFANNPNADGNRFRIPHRFADGEKVSYWDWSLPNPWEQKIELLKIVLEVEG